MRASRWVGLAAAAVGVPLLLFCAEPCAAGVYDGMVLCGQTLIPALFPFLVACELLCTLLPCRGAKIAAVLTVLLSAVGGYPAGVRVARQFYLRGVLTPSAARTLALCCCNAGPAFLVTAVGVKMLGDQSLGFLLLGSNLCAMLLTLLTVFLVRCGAQENIRYEKRESKKRDRDQSERSEQSAEKVGSSSFGLAQDDADQRGRRGASSNAVERAVRSMLTICAYTLLACCVLRLSTAWLGNGIAQTLFSALLEVTSGCRALANPDRLPMLAAVCAFGGLCVFGQNLPIAVRCGVRWYQLLGVRLLNAFFAFLLTLPFCEQPLLAVFSSSDKLTAAVSTGNAATAVGVFLLLCALALLSTRHVFGRK